MKIVILHGWTRSLDKWDEFVKSLKKLGVEVDILKIPGLTLKSDEVWDLERYVSWLNKKLSSEKSKIVLLGHSNGGRIALLFAKTHPEKIKNLILIDSAGIYHKGLVLEFKRFIFKVIAKVGRLFTNSQVLRKLLYKTTREDDYLNAEPNLRKTMVNLINTDLTPVLKDITIPTLIIWGSNDKITPLSDAILMNSLIKESELEIVSGARHSPFYTNAKEVSDVINRKLILGKQK